MPSIWFCLSVFTLFPLRVTIIWLRFSPCILIFRVPVSPVRSQWRHYPQQQLLKESIRPTRLALWAKYIKYDHGAADLLLNNETDVLQDLAKTKVFESTYQKPNATELSVYRAHWVQQSVAGPGVMFIQDTCSLSSNISTGKMSMRIRCTKSKTASSSFKVTNVTPRKPWREPICP